MSEYKVPIRRRALSSLIGAAFLLVLGAAAIFAALLVAQPPAARAGAMLPTGASPSPTQSPCGLDWRVVASPVVTEVDYLTGVAVVSSNDIWAVGSYYANNVHKTLTMHYTNGQWDVVPSPNVGNGNNDLQAVTAISANDIWAVGGYTGSDNVGKTLTMHYTNGQWDVVPSPSIGNITSGLAGVAAVSANDVWAVGNYFYLAPQEGMNKFHTLSMHYTNGQWDLVTTPNVGQGSNFLSGVAAISADDVWAVGIADDIFGANQTLTMHYTGGQWQVVPSPSPGTVSNDLTAVSAVSANDIWAVGITNNNIGYRQTLTMHYTGGQWQVVPSPDAVPSDHFLSGVDAISANDVWAVGSYNTDMNHSLLLHYTGGQWQVVTGPDFGGIDNSLGAIAAVSADDIWAVGGISPLLGDTMTMHYSDPCGGTPSPTSITTSTPTLTATSASTATPTNTPATPTNTPAPSNTPTTLATATSTACVITFTDVPPDHTFYSFVRCMACRGIIAGYTTGCETGDPCFRPNNNITRGQLSKVVANAANFQEPTGAQQYEDVPVGSTFFDFVWRLADRGYITGYPCGGPGEPCGAGNLPYFRPNATSTRGQISKIVSNAAGFSEPAGAQAFEDVPPAHTFYDFIQRLATRGVMGGYPCGGPGEPCGAGNLPYFRPASNATRGQTAKIVSNTFYPDCPTP